MRQSGPVPGSKKLGRKPVFSAAEVVEAAFAEGIDRFTLAAVARHLGVVPASIFRLFPSREELVLACLDMAGRTIALPTPGMGWREALQLWADECWRLCEEYPGLERVLFTTPSATARIEPVVRSYADHLGEEGITPGSSGSPSTSSATQCSPLITAST